MLGPAKARQTDTPRSKMATKIKHICFLKGVVVTNRGTQYERLSIEEAKVEVENK